MADKHKRIKNSKVLKEFPTLDDIMFGNKKARNRSKAKKFFQKKK